MRGHIHAELMAQYAEDARETSRPWERWEYQYPDGSRWTPCVNESSCCFFASLRYRRKPRTITINGREVPEPMRKAPGIGDEYFLATTEGHRLFSAERWENDATDKKWLSRGLCHSTKEAAIAHAEAMLSFTECK